MTSENATPAPTPDAGGASKARAELQRLEEKLHTIGDPDIRAVLVARIEQLYAELPAPEVEPHKQAVPEELEEIDEPLSPPTPEQMERAEVIVRQAHVEKMRGNRQAASDLLKQATEVAPTAPALLEALGDDLMERRNFKQARASYEKALKVSPKSVGLERKYAEAVLKSESNLTIEDQMRMGFGDTPFLTAEDQHAGRKSAVLLNAFFPGIGQLALGQTKKGIVIVALWVVCLATIALLHNDFSALMRYLFGGKSDSDLTMVVLIPIFGALVIYIAALADLKTAPETGLRKVDRPKPPANLPFE